MTAPFAINDKVMRVASTLNPRAVNHVHPNGITEMGKVYCVTEIWFNEYLQSYAMALAGFPALSINGFKTGFRCANFRKVEEARDILAAGAEIDSLISK